MIQADSYGFTGYTLEILQDAQVYADHAQRPRDPTAAAGASTSPLEVDDLRMAVSSKLEHSYTSPLPKEFLLPLAAQINRVPLPILPESYGIRLPHERDRLTAVNWDLAPVTEKRSYPGLDQQNQLQNGSSSQQGQLEASTSSAQSGTQANGLAAGASGSGMDLDMAGNDLFGGNDDDDEDDDDDDEEMEEVVDTSLQADQSQSKDAEDAEADEDAEEDDEDAEEDDDNAEDEEDEEDGDGQDDT